MTAQQREFAASMSSLRRARGGVRMISARGKYLERFPTSPLRWKSHAFQDELARTLAAISTSCGCAAAGGNTPGLDVIVLGDSLGDLVAAQTATKSLHGRDVVLKFIKFKEAPSVVELTKQLIGLVQSLPAIVKYPASFHTTTRMG